MEKRSGICKFPDAGFQIHFAALKDASIWAPVPSPPSRSVSAARPKPQNEREALFL